MYSETYLRTINKTSKKYNARYIKYYVWNHNYYPKHFKKRPDVWMGYPSRGSPQSIPLNKLMGISCDQDLFSKNIVGTVGKAHGLGNFHCGRSIWKRKLWNNFTYTTDRPFCSPVGIYVATSHISNYVNRMIVSQMKSMLCICIKSW